MLTIDNIFDKFKSISIERVNDFLTRNGIEHHCSELQRIEFNLENLSWDLYVDDNYFKVDLVFPLCEDTGTEKHINIRVAEEACVEVTKRFKVLKSQCSTCEYIDKDHEDKLLKYNVLVFSFDAFCYNMYDFSKLFYDALNVIIRGRNEYDKLYKDRESKLPGTPVGFRQFDSDDTKEKIQTTNRHRVGFV